MLFENAQDGAVIADGRCGLRLSRRGEPDEVGFPIEIEVRAGPFCGAVHDLAPTSIFRFAAQLEALHATPGGEAQWQGYEGF